MTSRSPLSALKAQSDKIAKILKAASRGEVVDPSGKIGASIEAGVVKFAVVMDDKVVQVEVTWDKIRETSEVALSEYILKLMRNERVM
jgi:hypothetical protein